MTEVQKSDLKNIMLAETVCLFQPGTKIHLVAKDLVKWPVTFIKVRGANNRNKTGLIYVWGKFNAPLLSEQCCPEFS